MHSERTQHRTTIVLLGLTLAAAGTITACQGDRQQGDQPDAAASAAPGAKAPSARASAVHGEPPSEAPHATAAETMEIGYECADAKTFSIAFAGPDEILITIDGQAHTLVRTSGHTGMLFSNDDIVFYSKGREASVEVGGEPTFIDCVAQGHPE